MYALMNPDYTLNRVTSKQAFEWNGVWWSNVNLLTKEEKVQNYIFDFVPMMQPDQTKNIVSIDYIADEINGTLSEVVTTEDKSAEELLAIAEKNLSSAVQSHLDSTAQTKGYDNILSACSYTGVANIFQTESKAFVVWRSAVWAKCYEIMAEVKAGTRAIPTVEELISELPVFPI